MPSPFPGMDPYLEEPSLWPDFHLSMLAAMRAELNARVPKRYAVYGDRFVWIEEPDAETRLRLGKPDLFLLERNNSGTATATREALLLASAQVALPMVRRQGQRFLKIVDREGRKVITVIEVLSPANKEAGEERETYLAKRTHYLGFGTNVVEIDLLRSGSRLPMGVPSPPPPGDYYVLVCFADDVPQGGVWAFSVRDPLPSVPVPLGPHDPPVLLSLQTCFNRVYDESSYNWDLNYQKPPQPPLKEPNATWARELLAPKAP